MQSFPFLWRKTGNSNHPIVLLVSLFQLLHTLHYSCFRLNVNTFFAFLFTKKTNCLNNVDMTVDGREFWLRTDSKLAASGKSLRDLCKDIGVSYFTVNTQRKNHAMPKVEQLLSMCQFLGASVDELVYGVERQDEQIKLTPRVKNIAMHCMIASETDLEIVERVLRIDSEGEKKSDTGSALA